MANFLKLARHQIKPLFLHSAAGKQQIRKFSNQPRDFTKVYQAVIRHGDVDGRNRPVYYRDSEFKILPKISSGVRHVHERAGLAVAFLNAITPYSEKLTRFFPRSSLKTTVRQVGENNNRLTVFFQLPELNVHEVEVELEKDTIIIIWKTLEPSSADDYWSKMVIFVPFEPKSLEKKVDDTNLLSVTVGM